MTTHLNTTNDFVRRQIRRIRLDRGWSLRKIARLLKMPYSSYASMENGEYRMSLDTLQDLLLLLDVDIQHVWPIPSWSLPFEEDSAIARRRLQESRFDEVVRLSRARAGALFRQSRSQIECLLARGISDSLLVRIERHLERGERYAFGVWRLYPLDQPSCFLYLRIDEMPKHLEELVAEYLRLWSVHYAWGSSPEPTSRPSSADPEHPPDLG